MGCPVNAKQSMLVTTIPAALEAGATLVSQAKVIKLEHHKDKIFAITKPVKANIFNSPLFSCVSNKNKQEARCIILR